MRPVLDFGAGVGSLIVLAGCVYSGKSDELITQLGICKAVQRKVAAFVPSEGCSATQGVLQMGVRSHDGRAYPATALAHSGQLRDRIEADDQIIIIDDIHLLDSGLPEACLRLVRDGRIVLVAGRDMGSSGRPVDVVGQCLALADQPLKKRALCERCSLEASFTLESHASPGKPLCRACFVLERPNSQI